MECPAETLPTAPGSPGSKDACAGIPLLSDGRPISFRRRDPRDDPFDGVRRGSTDYCRQARRLRALYDRQPVRLHGELSQLKVFDPPGLLSDKGRIASIIIERLDKADENREMDQLPKLEFDDATLVDLEPSIPWTCLNAAKVGKRGVSVLSRLREQLTTAPTLPAVQDASPSRSGSFADYVADRVTGPVLAYADRLSLLHEAGRRGIGRFEANLVIAAVQHRIGNVSQPAVAPARSGRFIGIAVVAIVQSFILFGCWRLLHG